MEEYNKYHEVIIVVVFSIAIFWLLVGSILYFVLYYHRRKMQFLKEKSDLQTNFEKDILLSKIEIQEQAFNSISRELHDNIGQHLSLAKLHLSSLKTIPPEADREKIDTAVDLLAESIYQLRAISKTLLGEKVSNLGLVEAIKNEVGRIEKLGILKISLIGTEAPVFSDSQAEIILFRILQEALNNIVKHSQATQAVVSIKNEENNFIISVQDNGKGFNLDAGNPAGIGILNMKSRAQTIGAELFIKSIAGQGTLVEIILTKQQSTMQ